MHIVGSRYGATDTGNDTNGDSDMADIPGAWGDHLAKPQRLTDSVYESHKGRPVDDVLNELQRVSGELKIGLTRKQLLPYAEAISAGREVVWKVQDGSSQ